jgi:hypothetical protein
MSASHEHRDFRIQRIKDAIGGDLQLYAACRKSIQGIIPGDIPVSHGSAAHRQMAEERQGTTASEKRDYWIKKMIDQGQYQQLLTYINNYKGRKALSMPTTGVGLDYDDEEGEGGFAGSNNYGNTGLEGFSVGHDSESSNRYNRSIFDVMTNANDHGGYSRTYDDAETSTNNRLLGGLLGNDELVNDCFGTGNVDVQNPFFIELNNGGFAKAMRKMDSIHKRAGWSMDRRYKCMDDRFRFINSNPDLSISGRRSRVIDSVSTGVDKQSTMRNAFKRSSSGGGRSKKKKKKKGRKRKRRGDDDDDDDEEDDEED